ncbi:HAMP domain-containing histidine kinase [Anaerobacillus sp. CMMVII]|uniref:sensor histidine kinase n=1 Tax=Anaerobacillus sp. CMMVII TaxID=2755588 RepID=UPI0021B6F6EB|nr:HAMP domain-containing sensor histidine kinase [Anaerobacillus sp. CMMVII]MCT8137968.1 HAMP domain-containing histidine kinase [Anaerobacillus sp. CMMVII]
MGNVNANQFIFTAITAIFIEQIIKNNYIQQNIGKNEKLDMVSHLAASISHEIRNPLQVIKGFIQFLKTDEHDSERQKDFLNIMEKEVSSAEQIISDYLTFAKPTYDKVEVIDMKAEIENVINIIQPYANYSSVNVICEELVEGTYIRGDRQKLKQCLVNIARNCIESMPDGGELRVRTEVKKQNLLITMKDTGFGMTKEQIQRLGEPYFSTNENGTGLGMMVVYSIIKNMKGTLTVDSEVGIGTFFSIEFPLKS